MSKTGAIVIIEDDADDKIFLQHIFKELNITNKIVWFDGADEAFQFLSTTSQSIFIIFSDVKLPGKSGLELKHEIDADPKLRKKSIPFVFYSSTAHQNEVNEAYTKMSIQGFFLKEAEYDKAQSQIETILKYWGSCRHPNTQ